MSESKDPIDQTLEEAQAEAEALRERREEADRAAAPYFARQMAELDRAERFEKARETGRLLKERRARADRQAAPVMAASMKFWEDNEEAMWDEAENADPAKPTTH